MEEIICSEINDSQSLVKRFREKNEFILNRIFKCFFELFYDEFKGLVYKYCKDKFHTKHHEEELANDAFQDGLMSFYHKLRTEGFEEKGAKVKTAFFSFSIHKLMGLMTFLERRYQKEITTDSDLLASRSTREFHNPFEMPDYLNHLNNQEKILDNAFKELGERGTNLILWTKALKLSAAEIASRLQIKPDTVTNEVYRAFNKLKKIADRLNAKEH